MSFILFLSKIIFVSGVLYGYYWFFLRNKKFHQYNRFYLLSIPALSICIPLLNISIPGFYAPNQGAGIKLLRAVTVSGWEDAVVITAQRSWLRSVLSWQNFAFAIYAIIALIVFCAIARSVFYLIRLSEKYHYEKINEIKFYQTPEPGTPFSFLNNIFWNDKIDMNSDSGSQIFRHELYHVKQKHSADILFMELLCAVCWFNPFFHLIKKELKAVHEFLADQYAISGANSYEYAELLVWKSIDSDQFNIANPFFNNQIKRRIAMITQFKNSRYSYIHRIMALPLLFILFCAFGMKLAHKSLTNSLHANKQITVVIDAGHGGIDPGTRSKNGIAEKNIALAIAKKIQELSKAYNVNVIMTRETDILPGNASTIKEGLINRINIAESNKADLFISIHMDASNDESGNGFSIYISNKNTYYQKSVQLGSALTEEIKKTYTILPELKERQMGIAVLKSSLMPAVIVECGYITDKNDLAFITEEENQKKIAKDILEGVVKYEYSANNPAIHNDDKNFDQTSAKVITDTVLPADAMKIAPNDISSINVLKEKNIIIIKLKNGDSVIVKADELKSYTDSTQKNTYDYEKTFTKVEIEAEYPGGQNGWSEYLMKNLKYPLDAIKRNIQGTVLVQFIVNIDGSVSNIEILERPDASLSEVSYKIIKNSGNWIPAVQNGKKVRSYKKQPIVFKLEPK